MYHINGWWRKQRRRKRRIDGIDEEKEVSRRNVACASWIVSLSQNC